jgi:hypothetical protein
VTTASSISKRSAAKPSSRRPRMTTDCQLLRARWIRYAWDSAAQMKYLGRRSNRGLRLPSQTRNCRCGSAVATTRGVRIDSATSLSRQSQHCFGYSRAAQPPRRLFVLPRFLAVFYRGTVTSSGSGGGMPTIRRERSTKRSNRSVGRNFLCTMNRADWLRVA